MRTADFDYTLPTSAIGQPPPRRDQSRLLILDRKTGRMDDRAVHDLPSILKPGDCVVLNDTKVFRARLRGSIAGKSVELFLVRPVAHFSPLPRWPSGEGEREGERRSEWIALGKPGRRFRVGATVTVGTLHGIIRGRESDGSIRCVFDRPAAAVIAYANRVGDVPVPPYVQGRVRRLAEYQTAYARHTGSVAAPTAGFHITPRILRALHTKGVHVVCITLHVGLGTFQPIRSERLEDHRMHAEWADVPVDTARTIATVKASGSRVIAIGTTTLRALEGVARLQANGHKDSSPFPSNGEGEREGERRSAHALQPFTGWINLFIVPGFRFRVVDALLTNFHLPKSSLLVLVSAFAAPRSRSLRGRDRLLRAYRHAIRNGYRFYSFGDAMFIA